MAVTIMSNRKNASAVIHVASANGSLVVAGNSTVSDIATDNEVLTGVSITQAYWGCEAGELITLKRGSDVVAVYDSTGQQDYAGSGMSLTVGSTEDITVEFSTANAFIVFEVQKQGTFISDYLVAHVEPTPEEPTP